MIQQLKWKFVAILMVMISSILIFSFGLNFMSTKIQVEEEVTNALLFIAQSSQITNPWELTLELNTISVPFFAIELYGTGQVVAIWDEYYHITQEELIFIASMVSAQKAASGTLPSLNLRYVCVETETGIRMVCSDLSFETQLLDGFFGSTVIIAVSTLLLLFFLSLKLADKVLKPVEEAWAQQKQFVADASHELKTPLTVILSSAELLAGQIPEDEQNTRWLGNITEESQRMRRLIDDMLSLTKFQGEIERNPIVLSDLVEKTIMMFEPVAFEKDLFLVDELEENLQTLGDQDKLQQLVSILLDNAVKYSHIQEEIHLHLKEQGKFILLQVSNACDFISDSQCQQIFHRFYRQDSSRSKETGYGLGLSIAQSIVEGHQGKIWANYENSRLIISVRLPLLEKSKTE